MANTYTQIYIHAIFAVEGRQCLINPEHNDELQKTPPSSPKSASSSLPRNSLNSSSSKTLLNNSLPTPKGSPQPVNALCRLNRQLYRLQKYRDDSARELGYKHNPERLKRETDKRLETTRNIYSAEKLGDTDDEPDIPHRNFIPKNQFADDSVEDPAPPVDALRALSNFASLLKNNATLKPAAPSQ
jgi:hypothetical protein